MEKGILNYMSSLNDIEEASIIAFAIPNDFTVEQRSELNDILKLISNEMRITILTAPEGEEYKALLDKLRSELDEPESSCLIPVKL